MRGNEIARKEIREAVECKKVAISVGCKIFTTYS